MRYTRCWERGESGQIVNFSSSISAIVACSKGCGVCHQPPSLVSPDPAYYEIVNVNNNNNLTRIPFFLEEHILVSPPRIKRMVELELVSLTIATRAYAGVESEASLFTLPNSLIRRVRWVRLLSSAKLLINTRPLTLQWCTPLSLSHRDGLSCLTLVAGSVSNISH